MLQTAFGASCMNRALIFNGIRDSRKAESLWWRMRGVRKSIHQTWLTKGLGLGLLCWGFKGVQEKISSEKASTLQNRARGISTRTMYQSTTPSFSQTIWPRWASKQFLSLSIVQTLLPVTFAYSLSSETVVMWQLRRWKRLWRRSLIRSHGAFQKLLERDCVYGRLYLSSDLPTRWEWHKAFLRRSRRRATAHTHPAFSKKTSGPVGILVKRGASCARQLN